VQRGGERERLGVIARGGGGEAGGALVLGDEATALSGAAELKGADALQVLRLQEHPRHQSPRRALREVSTGVRCATPSIRSAAASTSS
jgi:hypothetical protein